MYYSLTIDKSFIEKQVSDATKREFKISGEISPDFGLIPSVTITQLSLANAEWASKKPLANIGQSNRTV